ncbi:conserved exported protein of unknown function [Nitrospira sp. KM1]|uniref:hypothetical protein n=1 Tax=Nitrospira sp. KM1 TaxID=1936990 RepID=UPI0013A7B350|nr:hypothetical protein [Nitrospira sp. KM1]BCA56155.1 conserved exported protein of unknown function [Nitrospira sp. KM1]
MTVLRYRRDNVGRPTGRGLLEIALMLALLQGCGVGKPGAGTAVRYVEINKEVTPRVLFARIGEEVRWHNASSSPIRVGILNVAWRDVVSCETGFGSFGAMEDVVTIPPQDYASLCFSKATTVQYNVWLDLENIKGSMSPTATIRVD